MDMWKVEMLQIRAYPY